MCPLTNSFSFPSVATALTLPSPLWLAYISTCPVLLPISMLIPPGFLLSTAPNRRTPSRRVTALAGART
ncbi:hypothetical protein HYPSUDRAFT_69305 [Hypholoma sublateritium FD-334 SS-4]|uniref:Uncharacterized protein n=1 Tax=Hypholoma sublateritium (strain FD-334 SS-4) TaxID=945553 RepID=A0A0D2M7Q9_HYPSF|nr:hypothetical protein HYPSUDRAFT_69305 [Hypholoma sublateritium FD-334 SS-4]